MIIMSPKLRNVAKIGKKSISHDPHISPEQMVLNFFAAGKIYRLLPPITVPLTYPNLKTAAEKQQQQHISCRL